MNLRDWLIKSVRSRLARREIVVGRTPSANRLDHALVWVLSDCRVDYVLDVGAHTGEFARFLRDQCGWTGPICSFEPVHSSFLELTRAMGHDRLWRGLEIALGSRPERTVIRHFPDESRVDSLLPLSEFGRRHLAAVASQFSVDPVTVQRLDAVIDDVLDIAPGAALFLKIDAQGFDLDVLRGTAGCMDRIVLLQLELSARAVYEGPPALGDAINEVMTLGFDPIGFFPVVRGEGFRVIEFDGLFRRAS